MLWGMSRIGTEERKQTRFSSRGRDCTGLVEVLMIFSGPVFIRSRQEAFFLQLREGFPDGSPAGGERFA